MVIRANLSNILDKLNPGRANLLGYYQPNPNPKQKYEYPWWG